MILNSELTKLLTELLTYQKIDFLVNQQQISI